MSSTQWGVSDRSSGGCDEYLFIGLEEYKYGYNGCADGDDVSFFVL